MEDEYLAALTSAGTTRGNPLIARVDGELRIRRKSKPAHPRSEPLGLNHSLLSDTRLSGIEYRGIERCRSELQGWRTYYLDPRVSMRRATPPAEVTDIGVLGENIAPFLYRLQAENSKAFESIVQVMQSIIPGVEGLTVDLDTRRGTIDVMVRHNGVDFPVRVISEGTLRALALCSLVVNPWSGALVAIEEPENGVHPRRLELIGEMLTSFALQARRQVLVTTHSPLFCDVVLAKARQLETSEIGLFVTRQTAQGTEIRPFETMGPLFDEASIRQALSAVGEDGLMMGLMLRGMLDG